MNKGYNDIEEKEKEFFRLFYLFICDDKEKLKEVYAGDEMMKEVKEKFDTLGKVIDGNLYLNREKYEETVAYEDGQADGIKIGHASGLVEGKTIGATEKQKEIAKNFLNDGIPIEVVSKNTGLSIEEIECLK